MNKLDNMTFTAGEYEFNNYIEVGIFVELCKLGLSRELAYHLTKTEELHLDILEEINYNFAAGISWNETGEPISLPSYFIREFLLNLVDMTERGTSIYIPINNFYAAAYNAYVSTIDREAASIPKTFIDSVVKVEDIMMSYPSIETFVETLKNYLMAQ